MIYKLSVAPEGGSYSGGGLERRREDSALPNGLRQPYGQFGLGCAGGSEKALNQSVFAVEFLLPSAQKCEAKCRTRFNLFDKRRGEECVSAPHSSKDKRAPAHSQQVFEHRRAIRQTIHLATYFCTEIEKLYHQFIQQTSFCNRFRK